MYIYLIIIFQVWSLEKPDWTCKIDEGLAGLAAVRWSPDGRHILSTADFQVQHSVIINAGSQKIISLLFMC